MKVILFFLISTIFSNSMSEWINSNKHIINSESYQISCKEKIETTIGKDLYYNLNNLNVIYFNKQIRYESDDKILIINQDSLRMLNKYSNQVFIDNINSKYLPLLDINPLDILIKSSRIKDDIYYFKDPKYSVEFEIHFSDKNLDKFEILYNDIKIKLSNIELCIIDSINALDYFQLNDSSSEIFDLREFNE